MGEGERGRNFGLSLGIPHPIPQTPLVLAFLKQKYDAEKIKISI